MNKPRKIKILFDAGPIVNGAKTGVGYYTYHLVETLAQNHPEWEFVGHYFNFMGRKHVQLPAGPNVRYRTSRLMPGKVLAICRRLGFQLPFELLIKTRGDVALFPNFVSLPCIFPIKKVVTIHDLGYIRLPEYVQKANRKFLKRFVGPSVKQADLVLSVSQFTKQEIAEYYHIPEDKILVTPIPPVTNSVTADKGKLKLPAKYILFLGTLEPRKNYMQLVEAYRLLPAKLKKEYGLVLAGGFGWFNEEALAKVRAYIKQGDNIVLTGYMSDAEREYVYSNAGIFAHASHYEGFGMPVLEALQHKLPAALSDMLVFREVAGDAAIYFNQNSTDSVKQSLEQLLTDKQLRQSLRANIPARLELFDWDKIVKRVGSRIQGL